MNDIEGYKGVIASFFEQLIELPEKMAAMEERINALTLQAEVTDIEVTAAVAAKNFGCKPDTLIELCKSGKIPYKKEGEYYLLKNSDLRTFKALNPTFGTERRWNSKWTAVPSKIEGGQND